MAGTHLTTTCKIIIRIYHIIFSVIASCAFYLQEYYMDLVGSCIGLIMIPAPSTLLC